MSTLVSIRNLHKTYRRGPETVDVLHGIDLDITKGDFVALMGPSGSGKTTLLNLIGGLDSPTSGEITVDGVRIDQLGSGQLSQWRSNNVGFVFQFYNLMPMGAICWFGPCSTADHSRSTYSSVKTSSEKSSMAAKAAP